MPVAFEVTAELITWAAEHAPLVDWKAQTDRMRDWEYKHTRTDWPAAWRTWMRKAQEAAVAEKQRNGAHGGSGETPYQRNQRLLVDEATGGLASRDAPGTPKPKETLDVAPAPFALG
jgi:hypothetical protein